MNRIGKAARREQVIVVPNIYVSKCDSRSVLSVNAVWKAVNPKALRPVNERWLFGVCPKVVSCKVRQVVVGKSKR